MTALHHALETYRGHTVPHFRFVERRTIWFAISGVLVALSLIGLVVSGLNYSIDFEGGAKIQYPLQADVTVADISAVLEAAGRAGAEVQIVSGDQVAIRTESLADTGDADALLAALADQAGIDATEVNVEDIGPTFGADVRRQAITGLVVVLAAISLYIAVRFEPKMALGAMIALVHDVVITAGIYALVGREVTPETVIAILTILGYSLYDTVVIYDKIKENTESNTLVNRLGYVGVVDLSLEPGADALGEHVAGRAVADPVAAAVRRRHAERLRVRDVRRGGDRRLLVDLPGGAAALGLQDAGAAVPADGGPPDRPRPGRQGDRRRRVGRGRRLHGSDLRCRGPVGHGAHGVTASSEEQAAAAGQAQAEVARGHRTDQGPGP